MSVLVRKVLTRYWDTKPLSDVSIRRISNDWNSDDDNWSVFKVSFDGSYNKNLYTDHVVLRLIANNVKKCTFGVDLFVLEDDFYGEFKKDGNYSEDKLVFNTIHVNLKNVNFLHLTNALEYSINKSTNVIKYTMENIRELFIRLESENKLNAFIDYVYNLKNNDKSDINQLLKNIQMNFLKDKVSFFDPYKKR